MHTVGHITTSKPSCHRASSLISKLRNSLSSRGPTLDEVVNIQGRKTAGGSCFMLLVSAQYKHCYCRLTFPNKASSHMPSDMVSKLYHPASRVYCNENLTWRYIRKAHTCWGGVSVGVSVGAGGGLPPPFGDSNCEHRVIPLRRESKLTNWKK